MKQFKKAFLILGFSSFLSLSAWCQESNQSEVFSFVFPVDKSMFAPEAVLIVQIYSQQQLTVLEKMKDCSVSYDRSTKTQSISCPSGIVYEVVKPEEFKYSLQQVDDEVLVKSDKVHIGEKFKVQMSGQYKDHCNQASSSVEGVFNVVPIKVQKIDWQATAMACVS